MFLDLFKKEKYPIHLETVRAAKSILYKTMSEDLELLNGYYGILPEGFEGGLLHDVKQLLGSDIADEFRLAFYDPTDTEKVYLERSYRPMNGRTSAARFPAIKKRPLPKPYEFDIFVYFSDPFLALGKGEQARLLNGFNFKWFNFNGYSDEVFSFADDDGETVAKNRQDGQSASAGDGAFDVALPSQYMPDAYGAFDVGPPSSPAVASDREAKPTRLLVPVASAEDAGLLRQFSSENSLLIAAYTDSRKLIEKFTRASAQLGLTPLQWTFSEGFREIGDKYAGKYMISDNYLLNAKLSPLEALGVIRNECQSHTLYLLEDFHYYLKRENLSGQDFVELISMMKSMPEVLKRQNSFVVILAPTLDLPPEIAPIFGVIRDEVAGRRLHFLERFGRDLTEQAEEGRIKPIVGRDREIYSCLKVLSQMEANNPILVGKAGVGKTAVVEGLAQLIVKREVPAMFRDKRIIALNLNAIVSGTKYRGEFETRIEGLVEEVKSNVGRIIVFIDEIHTLLGMGATEGSTGAENILKPSLARGEFPCIGATTPEEYRQYIEPDRALARRFQTVTIPEPDVPQSLDILRGIKSVYEKHYGLRITDQALAACVEMAARLLPTQCFPGKAIRMVDSVCASASLAGRDSVNEESVAEEFNRL
ncbi:MAG: AAA family ATPase [Syntrophales bacterium]